MPLRFTFRQLEYLVAVAETGTIATAAQLANVSSPSVSAAVSGLEAELGLQIFVRRHAQGLSLTPAGQRIYEEARAILDRSAGLFDIAKDIGGTLRGPVNLGCLTTLAPVLGPRHAREFMGQHPEASVHLKVADQEHLFDMLDRAEIDLCLTYDMDLPGDLDFTHLADLPPQVMLAADHDLASRAQVSLHALLPLPMVLLDLPLSRDYFLGLFSAAGLKPAIGDRVPDLEMMRGMVANGIGYGLVNIPSAHKCAPDGTPFCLRPLSGDHRPASLGLAAKKSPYRPGIVTAFAGYMGDAARTGHLI